MSLHTKLINLLSDDIQAEAKAMCSGRGVENIEEYRRRLGTIKGLEMALAHVNEAFKGSYEDDDNGTELFIN